MAFLNGNAGPNPNTWGSKSKFLERDFLIQVFVPVPIHCSAPALWERVHEWRKRYQTLGRCYLAENRMKSVLQKGKNELNKLLQWNVWFKRHDRTFPVNGKGKETEEITGKDEQFSLIHVESDGEFRQMLLYSMITKIVITWVIRLLGIRSSLPILFYIKPRNYGEMHIS